MIKTALVTGASSGIGLASSKILASNGYRIILNGRRAERLSEIKNEIEENFKVPCLIMNEDVRDRQALENWFNTLESDWQKIDVLVNNAGLAAGLASFEDGDFNNWDRMIDTNIKGLIYVSKLAIPFLLKSENPHIINIGSIAGKEVYSLGNVYCATKHAVDALNRSMRLDLSKYPIKVSQIAPGAVETEFSIVRFDGDEERAKKVYEGFENLIAEDIADALWYIVSRPKHVNINDLVIMPTAQPMAGLIHRKN